MDNRDADTTARNRFLVINLLRLGGAAMVLIGLLMTADRIGGGAVLGYVLLVLGLLDMFAVPQVLSRRWRTPPE
jgi:hypothetical protein